jgi:hypothetical protein
MENPFKRWKGCIPNGFWSLRVRLEPNELRVVKWTWELRHGEMIVYGCRRLVIICFILEYQETVQTKAITQWTTSDKLCGNQELGSQGPRVMFDFIIQQHEEQNQFHTWFTKIISVSERLNVYWIFRSARVIKRDCRSPNFMCISPSSSHFGRSAATCH